MQTYCIYFGLFGSKMHQMERPVSTLFLLQLPIRVARQTHNIHRVLSFQSEAGRPDIKFITELKKKIVYSTLKTHMYVYII